MNAIYLHTTFALAHVENLIRMWIFIVISAGISVDILVCVCVFLSFILNGRKILRKWARGKKGVSLSSPLCFRLAQNNIFDTHIVQLINTMTQLMRFRLHTGASVVVEYLFIQFAYMECSFGMLINLRILLSTWYSKQHTSNWFFSQENKRQNKHETQRKTNVWNVLSTVCVTEVISLEGELNHTYLQRKK